MMTLPTLFLPMTGQQDFAPQLLIGQAYVLYFYPRDDTPGCTSEAQDFRDRHDDFLGEDCQIFGVSRDTIASHEKFKSKFSLPFDLVSDPEEALCQALGVMENKTMYGKPVRKIQRSTFLVDTQGHILHEWRGVKVENHVTAVLEKVRELIPGQEG